MASTGNERRLALFDYGFRPFFLCAAGFAAMIIPIWVAAWQGHIELGGPFQPVHWHMHEMIFGFASAVIAGFLFTAVPNWTGRMPKQGAPLVALATLWIVGRLAVVGGLDIGRLATGIVDCGFLASIAVVITIEIMAGRNWRNLVIVIPVILLCVANIAFHVEAARGGADVSLRAGLAVVIFLITVIGGRIVPSFTRNWLAQRGETIIPARFGLLDRMVLAVGAIALAFWTFVPSTAATAGLLTFAGIVNLVRMARWRGLATWRSPLLLMLHVAFLFVPLGLVATGAGEAGIFSRASGIHLLGIGAIGGITSAVIIRATLGHTGRALVAGPLLSGAFAAIVAASIFRAISLDATVVAASLWTIAWLVIAIRLAPWLTLPSIARKKVSSASPRSTPVDPERT